MSALEQNILEKYPVMSDTQAISEAQRCLFCFDPPCVKACPTEIDIPKFINKIANKNTLGAARTILKANILGYSCAKACPEEELCAGACVYNNKQEPPIEIGRLQHFATNLAIKTSSPLLLLGPKKIISGKKIAFVGAGPASIAAAAMLAYEGHHVVIYDKRKFVGGLNTSGIAPYKLKTSEALDEINWLKSLGLEFCLDHEIDKEQAQKLESDYDALFLGVGLGDDAYLDIPGARNEGVYGACELIEKIKTQKNFSLKNIQRAHIVGGGNTALDIAQELRLLNISHVVLLYRREQKSMSGYKHELHNALKLGVCLFENTQIKEIIHENNKLKGYLDNNNNFIASDLIAFAIGQNNKANNVANYFSLVQKDYFGLIQVDKLTMRTDNPKIWAAGDCVNGGKEVVNAVGEAKVAVQSMLKYLSGI